MAERRRLILKFVLAALAAAAVSGVAAVLVASDEFLLRVMATCLAGAGAAAVVLPLTLLLERPRVAIAGLAAIGFVVLEFLIGLAAIWAEPILGSRAAEEMAIFWWVVALVGAPSCLYVALIGGRESRTAGICGLILTAGAAWICFGLGVWLPGRWYQHDEVWVTGWMFLGMAIPMAACLLGGLTLVRPWRWLGVIGGVFAIHLMLDQIWDWSDIDGEWVAVPLGASICVAYVNVIVRVSLRPGQGWLRVADIVVAIALTIMVDVFVFEPGDILGRITAALAILAGCGTLALVVLIAVNRRFNPEVGEELLAVRLRGTCPRCAAAMELPSGKSACPSCGLRFVIRMEEPRCASCSYLLYGLAPKQCPECGAPVRRDGGPDVVPT